ncbi:MULTISPECIES: thiol:disulfide interchange protein DsbG [Stenotrophomonas]|uniref:Thiol:disulfide interchange protein n=1 Tax=Stenotrophomonas lactitubi TaxID=2045214 RepID=A0AAW4GKX0_9GAMM|nr:MULTISPECIES: thiol:disulfide interchange protein DsbG [Stenotrophomonas]MBM9914551.1 thiol:disulfide interchange protein DsbG [Stenotrophomonas lactitubi]MBM9922828.1 thiol:disulfide interchange protein DsbG [Stenotrophomonas lactitubi]MBM9938680.1 thiol:disulfide interchange protein DsbG [Stenotrophomonas lactitubi]
MAIETLGTEKVKLTRRPRGLHCVSMVAFLAIVSLGGCGQAQGIAGWSMDHVVSDVPVPEPVFDALDRASYVQDGSSRAPDIIYVFSDPNCPHCHALWHSLRPWVASGRVQVRHILVGLIRADSPQKSAAIFSSSDPSAALAIVAGGGEVELDPDLPLQAVSDNQALMERLGLNATPGMILHLSGGATSAAIGTPGNDWLVSQLGKP